ncbi:MAG: gamma-glutamylcyclotransferase family protein [Cyanobacteria bacterium J06635_11]
MNGTVNGAMDKVNAGAAGLSVFTYGTLKPGGRYHRRYCDAYLTEAIPAMVKGRLFDFPQLGYPAMTVGADWVKGYLLKFSQPQAICDDILHRLDVLEGYCEENPAEANEYVRCKLPVFGLDDELLQAAWGYRMTPERVRSLGGVYLSSGDWPIP